MEHNDNNSVSSEEKCIICGNLIENDLKTHHNLLKKLIEKNPDKCDNCLEKIYTLKAYLDIKKHIPSTVGEYTKISQEFDKEIVDYYLSILKKHKLIKSLNQEVFILKEEDEIYETKNYKKYSHLLNETFKKEVQEYNFDNLDLIIQEEIESEKHKQNNNTDIKDDLIENIEEEKHKQNVNDEIKDEKLTENIEDTTLKDKNEVTTPPTVKHISISNLLGKKETKDENSVLDKEIRKDTIIENKKQIKENVEDSITEKEHKKESADNNPLPQIKHIDLSNLVSKNKSEPKPKKEDTNFLNNQESKFKDVIPKEEDIENSEPKLTKNQEEKLKLESGVKTDNVNKNLEVKTINESEIETPIIKDEIRQDETSKIENDNKKLNDFDTLIFESEEKNHSKDNNETNVDIIKETPKIPPKKSNGQYSLHKGVSYKIGVFKWTADIRERGKLKSLGLFDSEEEAYQARQDYINKKNINTNDSVIPPKKSNNRYSLHDRVDYDLNKGKWFAYIHEYGEDKFLGYFNSEKEAYLGQCKYLNIFVPTKQTNGQYSLHNGVSFNKRYCKWTATIRGRKRNKFLGYFCSELDALKAINVYEESKGQILNIWNPPEELISKTNVESKVNKFTKNFSYEPVNDDCMQISLNAKIRDDEELFKILYKLNSFYIKISSLEIKDMGDFFILRASFKIKSNILNKFILILEDDGWVK